MSMNPGFFSRVILLLTLTATSFVTKAQVAANFNATPVSGCSPLIVRFTDASTGNPTQWVWDLGNGTVSFLQNPSAAYFSPGKYTVKLVVRNANSEDSLIKTEYIEVFANPAIDFTVSNTTGCYPLDVNFTDMTTPGSGTITSWLWDFGDGTTSTEQNPSHTYTSARNFNVTLQVRNSSGCVSTFTKTSLIEINSGVLAQFDNDNPETCRAPVTINFHNQSTGTGTVNYHWNFGDGNTSDLANPSHTYSANGTYTVSLITTNDNGCTDTIIKANAVTVGSVEAMFTAPAIVCEKGDTRFPNTSVPTPASVTWNYGDGATSTDLTGIHNYAAPGNYTVKMVANFGACTDSASIAITVLSKPTAAFTASDTANCKAPLTVNFTNQSTNATSYSWDFGDNTTSTLQNPSHTYTGFGNFTVKLVVTNSNGCSDSMVRSNYININSPVATVQNLPDSGCVPFTKSFSTTLNISDPITSYAWNFGDGNTSNSATPTNTYAAEGVYTVTVVVVTATGCTDTATFSRAIVASNKPTANFSATPLVSCARNPIRFTNLSTGGITRSLWFFGDSTTSYAGHPSHSYIDTGYFSVKLKVWKDGCADSITFNNYIRINPPVASFTVVNDCRAPLVKRFTVQHIGAEEWHWDFGDGTTASDSLNQVHTFPAAGVYTVRLRVVNNTYGCDYVTQRDVYVTTADAQFTTPDTSVCKGTNVPFTTGISLNDISILNWNFGDGTQPVNSLPNTNTISHVFDANGVFTVRLILTDKNGCRDTLRKTQYISVTSPTARFTPAVPGSCLNSNVVFNDNSVSDGTNPIQQWQWNYGDGATETLAAGPFQHFYATAGTYFVKLKVTDTKGCADSTTLSTGFTISSPHADFSSQDTFSCPGKQVRFVNQSTGPGLTSVWNFGDNTTSNTSSPSHAYATNGTYSVKLAVTDQFGCKDSVTKTNYINISTAVALFTVSDSMSNCPPLIVNFTNHSTGAESIRWDFGDSTHSTDASPAHFYNYPGTYFARLTVTGKGGCTSVYQKRILIKGPEGHFSYNPLAGCNPVVVNFAAASNGRNSFVWDFSDGTTIASGDSILTHTYSHPGRYVPKMILIDQTGCQVPIIGNDTILVSEITNNFSFNNRLLCDSGIVLFSDSSTIVNGDNIISYQWNFGDGNREYTRNPGHQYTQPGIYYPELITVSRQGCTDTLRSPIPLRIVASPDIRITNSGSGCTPIAVTYNAQLAVPDTSAIAWQWNFGNGNTSASQSPAVQNYTTAGVYTITLSGTNSSGCRDTVSAFVESYAIPVINAGTDFILCNGSSATLQATGADSYSWSPATALSCTDCATPATTTTSNTTYTVIGSAMGCTGRDSITVTVKNKLRIVHSSNDSVCAGSSKKMTASGANSYAWSPAAGLDNPNISEPTATPSATTMYTVIGSDDVGCFKDTGYISIKVNPLPAVEAGIDKTINVGSTVDLVPEISPDVSQVIWQPTTGVFRNSYPAISVKPVENTEYTVLARNRGGCEARDRVTVFVICNGSNIFMPNTFSPNGDGTNDIFYPRGTGLFKVKSLRIFTRWGEIVFEKTNFDANNPAYGWDGTKKGKKINPDVFVYTLELVCDNGSVLTYHGNISVVQ